MRASGEDMVICELDPPSEARIQLVEDTLTSKRIHRVVAVKRMQGKYISDLDRVTTTQVKCVGVCFRIDIDLHPEGNAMHHITHTPLVRQYSNDQL